MGLVKETTNPDHPEKMIILSPYTFNTPPGRHRPDKLEKYLIRSKYKAFRSLGKPDNCQPLPQPFQFKKAQSQNQLDSVFKGNNQRFNPKTQFTSHHMTNSSSSTSNKMSTKSSSSSNTSTVDKKTFLPRTPLILLCDGDKQIMDVVPPPTISLSEKFSHLPMKGQKKRKKNADEFRQRKRRRKPRSVPSNVWLTANKISKACTNNRPPQNQIIDSDDDDDGHDKNTDDKLSSNVDHDSKSKSGDTIKGAETINPDNLHSQSASLFDDLDAIDDILSMQCSDLVDFILNPDLLDFSQFDQQPFEISQLLLNQPEDSSDAFNSNQLTEQFTKESDIKDEKFISNDQMNNRPLPNCPIYENLMTDFKAEPPQESILSSSSPFPSNFSPSPPSSYSSHHSSPSHHHRPIAAKNIFQLIDDETNQLDWDE